MLLFSPLFLFISFFIVMYFITFIILLSLSSSIVGANRLIRLPILQQQQQQGLIKRDVIPALPLYNANAREYLVQIGIGTPPQLFNVTLDTGRYISIHKLRTYQLN